MWHTVSTSYTQIYDRVVSQISIFQCFGHFSIFSASGMLPVPVSFVVGHVTGLLLVLLVLVVIAVPY
jgi:hypothetical protein